MSRFFVPFLLSVLTITAITAVALPAPTTPLHTPVPEPKVVEQESIEQIEQKAEFESLRTDVNRHPKEFVVFATRVGAERFISDHALETSRETQRAMVERGILGYWRGKTLVVVPVLPLAGYPL
jgi:hypothetical protein